jgi:hypothetical protein
LWWIAGPFIRWSAGQASLPEPMKILIIGAAFRDRGLRRAAGRTAWSDGW